MTDTNRRDAETVFARFILQTIPANVMTLHHLVQVSFLAYWAIIFLFFPGLVTVDPIQPLHEHPRLWGAIAIVVIALAVAQPNRYITKYLGLTPSKQVFIARRLALGAMAFYWTAQAVLIWFDGGDILLRGAVVILAMSAIWESKRISHWVVY